MTATAGAVSFLEDFRRVASIMQQERAELLNKRGLRGIHQTTYGTRPPFTDANVPGNCTQAAIATVLGVALDDVPHFVELTIGDPRPEAWWEVLLTWTEDAHGFSWVNASPEEALAIDWASIDEDPRQYLLLGGGITERGWRHHIVIDGALEPVWDPNPGGNGHITLTDVDIPRSLEPIAGTDPELYPIIKLPLTVRAAR